MGAERGGGEGRVRLDVCARCGAAMRPGTVKYLVRIEVMADWDGHLTVPEEDEERERAMRNALQALRDRDEDELLREVYHREMHLLCPSCRERYLANTLNMPLPEGQP